MARGLAPVPMFGSGVYGKSAVVTRQRRLNCYYELREDGDKGAKVVVYGTPGLRLEGTVQSALNTPVRGMIGSDDWLYAVAYDQFQSLDEDLSVLFTGMIGTTDGKVSLAASPSTTGAANQVVLVDGSGGWVYSPNAATFTALTAAWFVPGAKTVTNIGGYFVAEYPNSPEWGVSNLNDATSGSALSFGTSAAYPDITVAVDNLAGNLITFGRNHMEFWQPLGTPPPSQPFGNVQSATNEIGLAAIFSRAHAEGSILFLGQTRQGTKRVYRLTGYQAEAVSEEIDYVINTEGFLYADAEASTYQRDKHPFYQLTFPSMNRSFLLDLSTGIWGEAQTGLSQGPYKRHRMSLSTYWTGATLLSDYQNGNVYRMDDTAFSDNGETILREVITRHATKNFDRFKIPQVYLDMETGVGTQTGQGFDPIVSIECSKDEGRTWLLPRYIRLGKVGEFVTRVVARRFGQSKVFTFRIRMTDPVKFVITNGAIKIK